MAGEAGAAFFSISGSDFVELYHGVGAARVRDLFKQARQHAPAIVFIDELDSVGRRRGGKTADVGGNGEQEQALNQILAELDGFSPLKGIIVVAATNRPDVLDPALLRPGRFDRSIGLERADEDGRHAVLALHARRKPLADDVDWPTWPGGPSACRAADLAGVMNDGCPPGRPGRARHDRRRRPRGGPAPHPGRPRAPAAAVDARPQLRALGRRADPGHLRRRGRAGRGGGRAGRGPRLPGPAGAVRPDGRPAPRGFLLVGAPGCGKTLLARAVANEANVAFFSVAATQFVEVFAGEGAARVRDLFAEARSVAPAIVFLDEVDAIGARRGLAAEGQREREQTLNQILIELDGFDAGSGVIVQVGELARQMVCQLGMSPSLGPIAYPAGGHDGNGPLAGYSEQAAGQIDTEVRRLVDDAYRRAAAVLEGSRAALDRAAAALLEHEPLTADELAALVASSRAVLPTGA